MKFRVENMIGTSWYWVGDGNRANGPGISLYDTFDLASMAAQQRATWSGLPRCKYRVMPVSLDSSESADTSDASDVVLHDTLARQAPASGFVVKDDGTREQLAGGMVRSTSDGKTDYTLVLDGPMFIRWAEHLTKGARVYAKRNWMLAAKETDPQKRQATTDRYKESLLRHLVQYLRGDTDEDHAAAIFFNVNGLEFMKVTSPTAANKETK